MLVLKKESVCVSLLVSPNSFDSMDCSLPGSSVLGILQQKTLEWVVIPSSKGSPHPRD